jgi:hypothetical protein
VCVRFQWKLPKIIVLLYHLQRGLRQVRAAGKAALIPFINKNTGNC